MPVYKTRHEKERHTMHRVFPEAIWFKKPGGWGGGGSSCQPLSICIAWSPHTPILTYPRKKKKNFQNNYNDRVFRNGVRLWNFIGTQNRLWTLKNITRFLIHALELKLQCFEVLPNVCIGKLWHALRLQCFLPTHYVRAGHGARLRVHINVTTFTLFAQNCNNVGGLLALCM